MHPLSNAAAFLVNALFGLYIVAVMLRFLLQLAGAHFYNEIVQILVRITNPVVLPLRRVIPSWGAVDMAAIVAMLLLKTLQLWLNAWILGGHLYFPGILLLALAQLLWTLAVVYIVTIIIQALMSWVAPRGDNPMLPLLYRVNEPLLRPVRRVLPMMGGLDLSPLVVIIALNLAIILLVTPLQQMGAAAALSP